MICFFCGAKISNSEINKKNKMARLSQCSIKTKSKDFVFIVGVKLKIFRFLILPVQDLYFDYKYLQKHKELFKNTLILIDI